MVVYRYLYNGRMRYSYPETFDEAIRRAARDHNEGKLVDQIRDDNRVYNRQEILSICDNSGLLR